MAEGVETQVPQAESDLRRAPWPVMVLLDDETSMMAGIADLLAAWGGEEEEGREVEGGTGGEQGSKC